MTCLEYIATGSGARTQPGYFDELLAVAQQMPDVHIKKVGPRYVVFAATESDLAAMANRLGDKYQISVNQELDLF